MQRLRPSSNVERTAPSARPRRLETVGFVNPKNQGNRAIPALSSAAAFEGRHRRASDLARTSIRALSSHVTRVLASTRARLCVDGVELKEISGVGDRRERAWRRGVCGRESVRMRERARVELRSETFKRDRVGVGARGARAGVRGVVERCVRGERRRRRERVRLGRALHGHALAGSGVGESAQRRV